MKPNLTEIQEYLKKTLDIDCDIIDDSHLHTTHQNFQTQKAYLTIVTPSYTGSRIAFQRKVMHLVQKICNQPIHAIAFKKKM